ncbi:hypothetical protein EPUS_05225 [Endocarpon pusillum Z07020]|uniref:Uncharacterized protein n=1 Tax=Endocarpon pusillum (strain Z07020 / HMAS-L-300199) TaxID=1263415 RepID=U1GF88_ENDPU|nr:uncharacterized protein EPUS_05225 [Endocarpon pusillum Z07020]ERF70406.1 hypothetical protein EPUS_05225 [Endocarpon pusillum Z07020]
MHLISSLKEWWNELKVWKRVALLVSVAALIFTILALYATFTANHLAERSIELQQWSNNVSWFSYLAALEGNRISLMQFCVNNSAAVGCENVVTWSTKRAYLNTSLVPNLYPPDPLNTSAGATSEDALIVPKTLLATKAGKSFVAGSFIGSFSLISAIVFA